MQQSPWGQWLGTWLNADLGIRLLQKGQALSMVHKYLPGEKVGRKYWALEDSVDWQSYSKIVQLRNQGQTIQPNATEVQFNCGWLATDWTSKEFGV